MAWFSQVLLNCTLFSDQACLSHTSWEATTSCGFYKLYFLEKIRLSSSKLLSWGQCISFPHGKDQLLSWSSRGCFETLPKAELEWWAGLRDGWTEGWVGGWVDEWMDGWMDGWRDHRPHWLGVWGDVRCVHAVLVISVVQLCHVSAFQPWEHYRYIFPFAVPLQTKQVISRFLTSCTEPHITHISFVMQRT